MHKPGLTQALTHTTASHSPPPPGQLPGRAQPLTLSSLLCLPLPENIGKAQVLRLHSSPNPAEKGSKAKAEG